MSTVEASSVQCVGSIRTVYTGDTSYIINHLNDYKMKATDFLNNEQYQSGINKGKALAQTIMDNKFVQMGTDVLVGYGISTVGYMIAGAPGAALGSGIANAVSGRKTKNAYDQGFADGVAMSASDKLASLKK